MSVYNKTCLTIWSQFLPCLHNCKSVFKLLHFNRVNFTLSNVDDGETVPTPVTTVLSLQNLMDANKFLVLFNVI